MRPIRILFLASLLTSANPVLAEPTSAARSLQAKVTFLADDLLEGRLPGTAGYDIAARYVASEFEAMGLEPAGDRGGWYQTVRLYEQTPGPAGGALTVIGPNGEQRWVHGEQSLIHARATQAKEAVEAPLVFAGYGLDAPKFGFDDYKGLDVRGSIVVVLGGSPRGTPSEMGAHLSAQKAAAAERRGAIGIIQIDTLAARRSFPWSGQLEHGSLPRLTWIGKDDKPFVKTPNIVAVVYTSPTAAVSLFEGSKRSLEAVLKEADRRRGRPKGFALATRARVQWESRYREIVSANVLARLPGSDPALKDDLVVMMAHLDHVGRRAKENGDAILNGALDNAAGVAMVLEVARAMSLARERPRRSILFVAVTAEEAGLLGTYYLAAHPPAPLERIAGVVNIDVPMITYPFTNVVAFGAGHSTLGHAITVVAERSGVTLSPDPLPGQGLFTRSDHYAFVRKGVPSLMIAPGIGNGGDKAWSTYLKQHYHQPSDDLSQPFDWDAGARFAHISELLLREIANTAERPRWNKGSVFETAGR